MADKLEVIYYELVKLEDRITKKAEAVLQAREDVEVALRRFESLQRELMIALDECRKRGAG